jgi:ABC-type lipoprotein release transport system permease subunit
MIKLVFANVLKHKILFLLIGAVITLFTFYLILSMDTVFSVTKSLSGAVASNLSGDAVVIPGGEKRYDLLFKQGEKEFVFLDDSQSVLKYCAGLPYVDTATPRLRVRGFIQSDKNTMGMFLVGVNPGEALKLLPGRYVDDGRWLENAKEAVLYFRHADRLSVRVNDYLGIMVPTVDHYSNYKEATVVGTVDYRDVEVYSEVAYFVFIDIGYLNELIGNTENKAGEICVRFGKNGSIGRFNNDLHKRFGNLYRVISPSESSPIISGISLMTMFTAYAVSIILLLLVYLCSSFIITLSIETRRKEIGIYQAMGVKKWRIGVLFGGEFCIVMAAFGITGVLAAAAFMSSIAGTGIEASIFPLKLIFGTQKLIIHNSIAAIVITVGALFFSFLLNTATAILKLARLNPVEVMREL